MKILIGHDSRQSANSSVCLSSLKSFGYDAELIELSKMRELGYTREEDGSTEFAYTRFLTPMLCDYEGLAIFCDSDFLWRKSPKELELLENDVIPVYAVKHEKMRVRSTRKFLNNKNEWYDCKWWSSMMVFNCGHPEIKQNLTMENINTKSSQWLHRFEWSPIVAGLGTKYNHLVGYYPYREDAIAVHFTDGTPMYEEYRNEDYAEEYLEYFNRL